MEKWSNLFGNQEKTYLQLASSNRDATEAYNKEILSAMTLLGGSLTLLPLITSLLSNTKTNAIPAYLVGALINFVLFFSFRLPAMKKHTLPGLYIGFSVFFFVSIYLSVVCSPDMRATVLLGAFCITPLGFIDRPSRMNLFVAFWFVVHTILAFYLKPLYVLDDIINCLCCAILGCFLGNMTVRVRLESYEARRLLTIEKETDVLTGLFNRRKLFETLAALETKDAERPSGILMADIDYFKCLNDSYGHATGDKYLSRFGEVLRKFAQNFRLQFYRYGGEEFVAMAYGYSERELYSIAESLRIAVQSTDMDGSQITVSIGVAYCGNEQVLNYEKVIDRADQATYAAKHAGRNRVCMKHEGTMEGTQMTIE